MVIQQRWFVLTLVLAAFSTCFGFAVRAHADVFRSVDNLGVVHLTNVPNDQHYRIILRSQEKPADGHRRDKPVSLQHQSGYHDLVVKVAHEHNLDQALLEAVIAVESNYNPNAVSSQGAVGLMQLMPKTAQRYGVTDRTDPEANVQAGARYLRDLMQRFHGDLSLALAAYNAGENAVTHYGNQIPPYPETQRYVPRVIKLYRRFRTVSSR